MKNANKSKINDALYIWHFLSPNSFLIYTSLQLETKEAWWKTYDRQDRRADRQTEEIPKYYLYLQQVTQNGGFVYLYTSNYRCTTISWCCLQNTYIICFMSTNINQRYIILNLGYCRVFVETRQHPRFKIVYRWFMFVDIKRMLYVFCKQRQLIVVHQSCTCLRQSQIQLCGCNREVSLSV